MDHFFDNPPDSTTNHRGWPRPTHKYEGDNAKLAGRYVPMAWTANEGPEEQVWARVNGPRAYLVERDKLCLVCGEKLCGNWVYGLLFGEPRDKMAPPLERLFGGGSPSATTMHAKCAVLGALYCPHLAKQPYPAVMQDKETLLSLEDLRRLAKEDRDESANC